jgi:hypothetical protein
MAKSMLAMMLKMPAMVMTWRVLIVRQVDVRQNSQENGDLRRRQK